MSALPAAASTDDLEALFDQVAASYQPPQPVAAVPSPQPAANEPVMAAEDDLEALFDQVSAASAAARSAAPAATAVTELPVESASASAESVEPHDVFHRIGALTRNLHDALRELGYDKNVETAVNALPDARARLAYIANLTGNAAERALGAAERGTALQEAIQTDAAALARDWDDVYAGKQSVEAFKATADRTRAFLNSLAQRSDETNAQFIEVMMAQDFHDLTGQVINRIASVATGLEEQLVKLLLDTTPPGKREEVETAWLSGPVVDAAGRTDVVTSQGQVDDLLESLGF